MADLTYLHWLRDVFEEAQVPVDERTEAYLDRTCRTIAGLPASAPGLDVYQALRERFLQIGPPGYQLLAAYLRDAVYSRRDSPIRPGEGVGFFHNQGYPRARGGSAL